MALQRVLSAHRLNGVLLSFVLGFAILSVLNTGVVQAGDVASAEAQGRFGLGVTEPEAAVQEVSSLPAEVAAGAAWLDVVLYVIVASLILVAYGLAARKVPWLRSRHRRQT